jgi:hypothetical protein
VSNVVGQSEIMTASNTLDDLKHQAIDVLNRYLNQSMDLQGQGMLQGAAGTTNVATAEEIQHAQMKIQTRWDNLINLLRTNTHGFANTDQQNSSSIAAVAGDLRFT